MQESANTQSRNKKSRERLMFDAVENTQAVPDAGASPPEEPHIHTSVCVKAPGRPTQIPSKLPGVSKRAIRRHQLRQIVPLADTTIYKLEQRGEFPRRFYLTTRCVVWDASEVESWIEERRRASDERMIELAPRPDVRKRLTRPVRL